MGIFILVIAIFVLIVFTFIGFSIEEFGFAVSTLGVAIALLVWFFMFCTTPWEYTIKRYRVHTVDHVDIVVIDNRVFNLNEILHKDLDDGDIVNVHYPVIKQYVGITPPKSLEDSLYFSHEN